MIYRQRLNVAGWIGAAFFIFGPVLTGYLLSEYLGGDAWNRPSGVSVLIAALTAPLGAVLLLIGREYYDAAAEIESEAHARRNIAQHDAEARRKSGI